MNIHLSTVKHGLKIHDYSPDLDFAGFFVADSGRSYSI